MALGLVFSSKQSDWKSCTRIVTNILKSYNLFLKKKSYKIYHHSTEHNEYDAFKLAQNIQSDKIDELIFIDHDPHPVILIRYLSDLGVELNKVTFHIYGDFTLFIKKWNEVFNYLKQTPTKLVVASDKQKALMSTIMESDSNISVCPFPVDKNCFYFNEKIRKKEREDRNISDDETVFLYTGRISSAKHCHDLVSNFAIASDLGNINSKLYLAGGFDDIVNPVIGKYLQEGFYQQKFLNILRKLPTEIQERIEFLPGLGDQELLKIYNAADLFVSLSLYHDEDYGMSPIEALFCGVDTLLTDWGGYHSFQIEESTATKLVKTDMTKLGPTYSNMNVVKRLLHSMQASKDNSNREDTSKTYQEKFSIEACAKILQKIHLNKKTSTSSISVLGRSLLSGTNPFLAPNGSVSDQYFEVYKNYVTK